MDMRWTWFDIHWSWIGLAVSAVMLVPLFGTDLFRSNLSQSRWRDSVWLAWLAPVSYAAHQFEEYGIDALGRHFAFPDLFCTSMGLAPYPACSVPEAFFLAVNIPLIWGVGLVCALLARRHPLIGLGVYAIHFTNSLAHLGSWIVAGYNPGALTAALIQLPLSLWVAFACFGPGKLHRGGILAIVLSGTVFTVVLMASAQMFAKGLLSGAALVVIQILNPLLIVLGPWLFERWESRHVRVRPT
jgi:hypothetical protein